jgi:hypothetical protein
MSCPQFPGWGAQERGDVAALAAAVRIVRQGFGAQSHPDQSIGSSGASDQGWPFELAYG